MINQKLITGAGCLEGLVTYLSENYSKSKIVFCCSRSMATHPKVKTVRQSLALKHSVVEIIFSAPLLTQKEVDEQLIFLRKNIDSLPDIIIALGGGTILDLSKCIKAEHNEKITTIAIPTTAGSGSEATPFATFFDQGKKKSLEGPELIPDIVFLDPELLESIPQPTALAGALDTIAQATESLWSTRATEESKRMAEKSLKLSLPIWKEAVFNPNLLVLEKMQMASYFAGQAIAISQTTLGHALSYNLTARYGVSHGVAVFLNLPVVARFNSEMIQDIPHDGINRVMNIYGVKTSLELEKRLGQILEDAGLSPCLLDYGIKNSLEFEKMITEALSNPRAGNNPRVGVPSELLAFYFQSGALL